MFFSAQSTSTVISGRHLVRAERGEQAGGGEAKPTTSVNVSSVDTAALQHLKLSVVDDVVAAAFPS